MLFRSHRDAIALAGKCRTVRALRIFRVIFRVQNAPALFRRRRTHRGIEGQLHHRMVDVKSFRCLTEVQLARNSENILELSEWGSTSHEFTIRMK